ncbi:MAG: 16S rRNA (guanine(527)-N(7))-methyltransferase RsmG [Ruminococcus sp.]|nr:16S rRNA (guanine(527)-N(7))-methyltransferase RsmG [Ruminococcus sp.]
MLPDFELCCSKFAEYEIELTETQYRKFDKYADFLVEYNQKVNLTAITAPDEILVKHFIDSCLVTKFIDLPEKLSIIDVGTGAGFPSVPLKIIRPDLKLTLLDSLNKRIVFLQQLCDMLEIEAEFIHGRAEDFSKMPEFREKFDFSCARAVAELSTLTELCLPFVRVGGTFISLKGPGEDLKPANNAVTILGGKIARVNEYSLENDERRLICIEKISQTPPKYPRNSAQIKKKPL